MAQSVKCLTLDFSSGHDLTVIRSAPSLALCWARSLLKIPNLPLLLPFTFSLSQKKKKKKKKESLWNCTLGLDIYGISGKKEDGESSAL